MLVSVKVKYPSIVVSFRGGISVAKGSDCTLDLGNWTRLAESVSGVRLSPLHSTTGQSTHEMLLLAVELPPRLDFS